jgi:hypothetical protein
MNTATFNIYILDKLLGHPSSPSSTIASAGGNRGRAREPSGLATIISALEVVIVVSKSTK